jgi:transcriptional regulator PpsR
MEASPSLRAYTAHLEPSELGALDATVAARVLALGGDIAMIVDRDGVIIDLAVSNGDLQLDGHASWIDRRWVDTVTLDSRVKVEELLANARDDKPIHWRELNHPALDGAAIALRYVAVSSGQNGRAIVIGRDHRAAASMQQRLLQVQQSMERDYAKLRDAEQRYRVLFQSTQEAVLIIDGATRRVAEANQGADRLFAHETPLIGKAFSKLFGASSQQEAASLLSVAQASATRNGKQVNLTMNGRTVLATASVFRQDRSTHFLVRVTATEPETQTAKPSDMAMLDAINAMPDGFVVTTTDLEIVSHNTAFLDMVQLATPEQILGQSLSRFLGRAGVDRSLLLENLNKHNVVRNFPTLIQTEFGDAENVEVSAVKVEDSQLPLFGFSIRRVARRESPRDVVVQNGDVSLPRSASDMSDLVGRVSLKEIVRDTTDVVERLCIEAALKLSGDNRASAAEILGVSRQSLYSKMHRFGIGNLGVDDELLN